MVIGRRAVSRILAGLPLYAAARARAEGTPKVIIATYAGVSTPMWKNVVTDPFTKETGISADVFAVPLPAASVAQAAGNPQFNLALVAEYSVPGLVARNLIELLTPDDIPGIRAVPEKLWPKVPDGRLMGMPCYFGLFGIAYNTSMASADDFKSWKALLDPKWKGQVSISRANFIAAYDVQLYAKLGGGNEHNLQPGYDFLRKLIPQTLNVYSSMASVESQLARGEVAAAPFFANEISIMRRNGDTEVAVRIPDEGGLILPYMLVMPKGAPNSGCGEETDERDRRAALPSRVRPDLAQLAGQSACRSAAGAAEGDGHDDGAGDCPQHYPGLVDGRQQFGSGDASAGSADAGHEVGLYRRVHRCENRTVFLWR